MKAKYKYNVHVWDADADNTETVFEAPAKPTLEQMYKLIGCDRVERVSGYDKSVSNRTFDLWMMKRVSLITLLKIYVQRMHGTDGCTERDT